MKILFCTNKFEEVSNGPAKFANLIIGINEQFPEHEIRILTEDVSAQTSLVYKLDLKYPKSLKLLSNFYRIFQYHKRAEQLRISEFPFDVIIYNNAFIGLLSALKWKCTIGMINDYNNACRNLKYFSFNYTFLKQLIFKQLERITVSNLDTVIVNSAFLAEYLSNTYNEPLGKFKVLYKGIELPDQFNRKSLDPSLPIKVLFVKAEYTLGGLHILIKALSRLPYCFELTVIGPKQEFQNHIENLTHDIKNINLLFRGYQPQYKVFENLLDTNLYIVPSYREALGVANLEALSVGVPVISTNVGGIPEILDNGKCGWMVQPGDEKELASTIQECIENKDARLKKTIYGLEYSMNFSMDKVLSNFIEILKS